MSEAGLEAMNDNPAKDMARKVSASRHAGLTWNCGLQFRAPM